MLPDTNCHRCGREVAPDARYCQYCGIGTPQRPGHLSQRHGLIAVAVTSAWVLPTLLLKTLNVSLLLAALNIALVLPGLIPLALAAYWTWRERSRGPLALRPFHPAIPLLVTLVWLSVSMLLASDPDERVITIVMWYIFTFGLALAWLAVFVAAIQTLEASSWSVIRRTLSIVLYVAPLPIAVYLVMLLAGQENLPLKARFQLSENALYDEVKEPQQGSHRAGLFQITNVTNLESCLFLETGGTDLGSGLAYCPDAERPSRAMQDSPPDIVMRPLNGNWRTADWWSYSVAESSFY